MPSIGVMDKMVLALRISCPRLHVPHGWGWHQDYLANLKMMVEHYVVPMRRRIGQPFEETVRPACRLLKDLSAVVSYRQLLSGLA